MEMETLRSWPLARVLQVLPKAYPQRARFEKQFREMCARLAALQQPDGLWRARLLDQQAYPTAETSGSGFILYALAYGVDELERDWWKTGAAVGGR